VAGYYFDSSALVKRYAYESGTDWVLRVTDPTSDNEIVVARIAGAEVLAAIVRKQRAGEVSGIQAQQAVADFEADFETEYDVIEVTPAVVMRAMDLIKRYGLRGYDSIQLACAMEVNEVRLLVGLASLVFVSADGRLNEVARAEGLPVEDPSAQG